MVAENSNQSTGYLGGGTAPHTTIRSVGDNTPVLVLDPSYGVVAFSRDPMVIPPHLLMAARSISGWVGGNLEETMRFSIHAGVVPIVETFPLEQAAAAYESMMNATVRFRAVLTMDS